MVKISNKKNILKGGDYMLKKAAIGAGVFVISALTAGTMAFAQTTTTPTSAPTTTTAPTTAVTSAVTPTPTKTLPAGAPATGKGE
jgi:hypothetical protein